MIWFLIFLARFCGMCQRTLGRTQTHLLTAAQNLGWHPGSALQVLALQRRQVGLANRVRLRRIHKEQKRAARMERRLAQKGSRS